MSHETLQICEIYLGLQGESSFAGLPCVLVRTAGCPLRCTWCDTVHAREGGEPMSLDEIVTHVRTFGVQHVELTGGEPLAQPGSVDLLCRLCDEGWTMLLETSGALDIGPVDKRVHIIMDLKCPSSGMTDQMRWSNLALLEPKDELKLVLADQEDYQFARDVLSKASLRSGVEVLLSAVAGALDPALLAEWMLEDRLRARLQVQLHKVLWPHLDRGA